MLGGGGEGGIPGFGRARAGARRRFGVLAGDHARRSLGREAAGEQIADAVAALLRRANAGPQDQEKQKMSKRDRRVAARTKAAAPARDPDRPELPAPEEPEPQADRRGEAEPLANGIPMQIFDPFAPADKRR